MLRPIELEVLKTVERGDTISELAAKLDHSESYLSRAVSDLVEKGLLHTERDGRRKRVIPSNARAVELYQDLTRQYSHIDFSELLTGKAIQILYYFDQPQTVAELATRSNSYRNTVNRILKRFRDRGIVGTTDSQYQFNSDFNRLHEFATELVHHSNRQRLNAVAPKGTILWEEYDEFLAQTETEINQAHFHETGLANFATFDLQFLLTNHRYYLYSEALDSISPAELCCHTLLIDDDSRHRSYCLLLLSHVGFEEADLRSQAEKYDLEAEIDDLIRYLETNGAEATDGLPPWESFQELAAEYEVELSQ